MRIIVATSNKGKLREIGDILDQVKCRLVCLSDLNKKFRIVEDGKSFFENALKKAKPVSMAYKKDFVVAEDSGLEVDYLNGAPGILSKRYCGPKATDKKNNIKLLKTLANVPEKERAANFVCCLVLFKNGELVKTFIGRWYGRIGLEALGDNGFGYDPIFYLPGLKRTSAQISPKRKNNISHRAKAFKKLKKYLVVQS